MAEPLFSRWLAASGAARADSPPAPGWPPKPRPPFRSVIAPNSSELDRFDYDRETLLRQALEAWRVNPLARRIVGLTSQYVVGGGIAFSCAHAATAAFLKSLLGASAQPPARAPVRMVRRTDPQRQPLFAAQHRPGRDDLRARRARPLQVKAIHVARQRPRPGDRLRAAARRQPAGDRHLARLRRPPGCSRTQNGTSADRDAALRHQPSGGQPSGANRTWRRCSNG